MIRKVKYWLREFCAWWHRDPTETLNMAFVVRGSEAYPRRQDIVDEVKRRIATCERTVPDDAVIMLWDPPDEWLAVGVRVMWKRWGSSKHLAQEIKPELGQLSEVKFMGTVGEIIGGQENGRCTLANE